MVGHDPFPYPVLCLDPGAGQGLCDEGPLALEVPLDQLPPENRQEQAINVQH